MMLPTIFFTLTFDLLLVIYSEIRCITYRHFRKHTQDNNKITENINLETKKKIEKQPLYFYCIHHLPNIF